MIKQKKSKAKIGIIRFRANGKSRIEKWYALARRFAAILAGRQKTKERCTRCFAKTLRDGEYWPRFGCFGCTEVETFAQECMAFFGVKEWEPDGTRETARG